MPILLEAETWCCWYKRSTTSLALGFTSSWFNNVGLRWATVAATVAVAGVTAGVVAAASEDENDSKVSAQNEVDLVIRVSVVVVVVIIACAAAVVEDDGIFFLFFCSFLGVAIVGVVIEVIVAAIGENGAVMASLLLLLIPHPHGDIGWRRKLSATIFPPRVDTGIGLFWMLLMLMMVLLLLLLSSAALMSALLSKIPRALCS